MAEEFSSYRIDDIDYKMQQVGWLPLDVMATGVTGAGKSSTLNSLFTKNVAEVGDGVEPMTMETGYYELNDVLRIWDTPGLGDGVENDKRHKKKLVELLRKTYALDGKEYGFVDMVLVIIEGSSRDMGSTYTLLNEVLVPNIQKERILVVINQVDVAMKGRHWNQKTGKPDTQLLNFLEEKALSVQRRVKEATGVSILKPVYYSAVYKYNLHAVLDFIIDNIPLHRRKLS